MTAPTSIYKSEASQQIIMDMYEQFLAQWPIPYTTHSVPTRHGNIFVLRCGTPSAPPLILLHGSGSNSAIWRADVLAYADHYDIYTVDLPGDPGKSNTHRLSWQENAYAEWMEDMFDALHITQATLIGISLGGWTAVKFALHQPQRVTQLVLICPGGMVPIKTSFFLRGIPLSFLGRWGNRKVVQLLFQEQTIPDGTEETMYIVSKHYNARIESLPLFTDTELQQLPMPVQVLIGTKDTLFDHNAMAQRLQKHIQNINVQRITNAGHALIDTHQYIMPFLPEMP